MMRKFVVAGMIFEADESELQMDIEPAFLTHVEYGRLPEKYGYFQMPWSTIGPRHSGERG